MPTAGVESLYPSGRETGQSSHRLLAAVGRTLSSSAGNVPAEKGENE